MLKRLIQSTALSLLALNVGMAAEQDPLQSVMWDFLLKNELKLKPGQVSFDERVEVYAPASVEDGMNVPVSVKVKDLPQVEEIIVLADHNPIQRALNYYPGKADPYIAFRMKVQEATPIRAVVRTADGQWYAGGVWLNAPGGGCTTASVSQVSKLWEDKLNVGGKTSSMSLVRRYGTRAMAAIDCACVLFIRWIPGWCLRYRRFLSNNSTCATNRATTWRSWKLSNRYRKIPFSRFRCRPRPPMTADTSWLATTITATISSRA